MIRAATPKNASSPATLNIPMPRPGALALLRHLGLGQPELGADQVRELLAQVVDEGADGRFLGADRHRAGTAHRVSTGSEKVISPS